MQVIKKLSGLLFLFLVFVSCHTEEPVVQLNRTVLVYLVANNNLSNFVDKDIAEIKEGLKNNAISGKIVLFVNKPGINKLIALDKDANGKITENILKEYPTNMNSVSVDGMATVFRDAFGRYPADKYALFLWSHGDGWLPKDDIRTRWFGQDGSNYMDISELKRAFDKVALDKEPYFDFIFFDDCFMQSVEVAYELRNYADYIFGCPTETPGPGAPYQLLVQPVFQSTVNIEKIVNDYYAYYAGDEARIKDDWPYGAAISVVKCSELEKLAEETQRLVTNHLNDMIAISPSSVQTYDCHTRPTYYDFLDYVEKFTTAGERAAWVTQLNKAIPYKASTPSCYSVYIKRTFPIDVYSGISVYIPNKEYAYWNRFYQTYEWYKASGWDKVMKARIN